LFAESNYKTIWGLKMIFVLNKRRAFINLFLLYSVFSYFTSRRYSGRLSYLKENLIEEYFSSKVSVCFS
jgi:hypothetical protein